MFRWCGPASLFSLGMQSAQVIASLLAILPVNDSGVQVDAAV